MTSDDLRVMHARIEREIDQLRADCEQYLRERGWVRHAGGDPVPESCVGRWRDPRSAANLTLEMALQTEMAREDGVDFSTDFL